MKYLAVLGRQPEISIAELEAISGLKWHQNALRGTSGARQREAERASPVATGASDAAREVHLMTLDINRLGGVLKLAVELLEGLTKFLIKVKSKQ